MLTAAALAGTLVLAACSDEPALDDFLGPADETVDDEPTAAPVVEAPDPEPEPEPDPVEVAVADAWRLFLRTADQFDAGDLGIDQVATLATDAAGERMVETWTVAPQQPENHRVAHDTTVTFDDDGAAVAVSCIEDVRWPSDDLPYGMYYLLDGVLVESDDGWKVDDYIDPMWTDLPLEPCVPEALEESLIALFAEDREFWWSISSQEMFPYTREMYEHHPTLLAYYEQDRDVLSMLSEERWFLSGTYRYMDRVRAELSMPNLIVLTRCSYIEDIWRHDVDTGERVEAAPNLLPDGYTNTLPYRYDNGTWVFIEATDDPNFDLVDGLGGYDGLGEECGPVDEFHTFEF